MEREKKKKMREDKWERGSKRKGNLSSIKLTSTDLEEKVFL